MPALALFVLLFPLLLDAALLQFQTLANSRRLVMLLSVAPADTIRALSQSFAIDSRCASICCTPSARAAPVEVFGFLRLRAHAGTTICVDVCGAERKGERRSDHLPPRPTREVVGALRGGFGGESSDLAATHSVGGASPSSSESPQIAAMWRGCVVGSSGSDKSAGESTGLAASEPVGDASSTPAADRAVRDAAADRAGDAAVDPARDALGGPAGTPVDTAPRVSTMTAIESENTE